MPVRSSDRRVGVNIGKMGREIIERRAFQDVIANDIPSLMERLLLRRMPKRLYRQQF